MKLMVYGDPHGVWHPLASAVESEEPDVIVLSGDIGLDKPLDTVLKTTIPNYLDKVWWIHGNHDAHSEKRIEWFDNLFNTQGLMSERNLHGKVVDINGVLFAGLGGHFQEKIWNPHNLNWSLKNGIVWNSREMWLHAHRERFRNGIPMKHRAAIWPEDYEGLVDKQADILVMHEAPSCCVIGGEQRGFSELDELAEIMGVKVIIHGHHHIEYDGYVCNGTISVFGAAKHTARMIYIDVDTGQATHKILQK